MLLRNADARAFRCSNVGLFIPRFSDTLGSTAGAGLLSAFNVSCIAAQILWGFLTDVSYILSPGSRCDGH